MIEAVPDSCPRLLINLEKVGEAGTCLKPPSQQSSKCYTSTRLTLSFFFNKIIGTGSGGGGYRIPEELVRTQRHSEIKLVLLLINKVQAVMYVCMYVLV